MPLFASAPFEDLVVKATSENNVTEDWSLIMDICDKVVNYEEGSKFCLQAIGKRLYHKVPRVVMQALILLDTCVKNCGKKFHLEIASRYFTDQLPKLLTKMHETTRNYMKQLIRRWAESDFKKDPELGLFLSVYYKMMSDGCEFPVVEEEVREKPPISTDPNVVNSQEEEEDIIKAIALSLNETTQSSSSMPYDAINAIKSISMKPYESNLDAQSLSSSNASSVELCKVRALYDFEAVENNELTIKTGEIIIVTDKSNNSWWKGNNHRGDGYFPANFTTEDLEIKVTQTNAVEEKDEEETLPKQIDEPNETVEIDEVKIEQALDWLNELDPTLDLEDPEDLVNVEKQCYSMSSLIEAKLQDIDKRCTLLNALNEELMKAVHSFYGLNTGGRNSRSHFEAQSSLKTPLTSTNKQQFVPSQYYMLNEDRNPMLSLPPSSQAVFVPVMAQSSQAATQYHPAGILPNVCYNPVITMTSQPKMDLIENKGKTEATTMMRNNMSNMVTESIPTSDEISKQCLPSDPGFPNQMAPMMYQTVFIPQHLNAQNYPAFSHYGSLPLQQTPRFIPPQSNMTPNSYIHNYVAQVLTPNTSQVGMHTATQPMMQSFPKLDDNVVQVCRQSNAASFADIKEENLDSNAGTEQSASLPVESKNT